MKRLEMSKLNVVLIVAAVFLGMVFSAPSAYAQDEEDMLYTYGIVKTVAEDQIVITEIDDDTFEEIDVTYMIDPGVKVPGGSLSEMKPGDSIDIDYIVEGGNRTAKILTIAGEESAEDTE
ncbi:hypothetical protein ACFL3N_01525 [Candidatus Omnitrophota bacterium]